MNVGAIDSIVGKHYKGFGSAQLLCVCQDEKFKHFRNVTLKFSLLTSKE